MSTISVFIVDANPTFQRMTTRLLRDYYSEDLTVVGTSSGQNDALRQAAALKPDILLLGQEHNGLIDLDMLAQLRETLPTGKIIVLERFDIHTPRREALDVGADAFVDKATLSTTLLPIIWSIIGQPTGTTPAASKSSGMQISAMLKDFMPLMEQMAFSC